MQVGIAVGLQNHPSTGDDVVRMREAASFRERIIERIQLALWRAACWPVS